MLKRLVLSLLLSLSAGSLHAAELEEGFQAFKAGYYEQALRLWLPTF